MFKTIARCENDTLDFQTGSSILSLGFPLSGTVTLPPGNYTELAFVQVLSQLLNDQSYGSLHADYDSANNVCSISTSTYDQKFRILTDEEVQKKYSNSGNTVNEILNNVINPSPTYNYNNIMIINRLRLQPIHYIYITSPNLGSYDTMSNFSDNIIKQIPVTSDYGYMIVDRLVSLLII